MTNARIISSGSYLPEKTMTNFDLAKIVDTSDEWIVERTGIKQRHIAADNQLTSDLAYEASKKAIKNASIEVNEIDAIILATTTPDYTFPSTATILQSKLGIGENCFSFDVQGVCCGFVYALSLANSLIKTKQAKTVLVVGAETISRIVDWKDRNTCVLFGDGAGAVILKAEEDEKKGILATSLHSDGSYFSILNTSGGVSSTQNSGYIFMEGREVFKLAVNKMSNCVVESLDKANLKPEDINYLIPHQANLRILAGVAKKLNLKDEQVVKTIENQANTSAASVPLALDSIINNIKDDDIVVLEALGGGLVWGSVILRW